MYFKYYSILWNLQIVQIIRNPVEDIITKKFFLLRLIAIIFVFKLKWMRLNPKNIAIKHKSMRLIAMIFAFKRKVFCVKSQKIAFKYKRLRLNTIIISIKRNNLRLNTKISLRLIAKTILF